MLCPLFSTLMLLCGCAAPATVSGQASTALAPRGDAAAEVHRFERAWLDAYETHDARAMELLLAEEFVITYPGGQRLARADVLRQIAAPSSRGTRFRTEEVRAHAAPGTVVLTGVLITETGTRHMRQLYTDTWVQQGGRWQVLSSHLSAPMSVPAEPRQM